jgi:hypothetical protein
MEQSREELNKKIKKYGFYAFNKNFAENGVGLIIFEENEKNIKGIRMKIGNPEKFEMTRLNFENHLVYDFITYIELLPKTVWKEFYQIYKK